MAPSRKPHRLTDAPACNSRLHGDSPGGARPARPVPVRLHGVLLRTVEPIFPRWLASGARLLRQRLKLAPGRCDCKGFSPKKRCGSPPRRGLSPAHEALLPCSAPAIGPRGAPRTHSDDLQTAFSVNPRLPPDAAGLYAFLTSWSIKNPRSEGMRPLGSGFAPVMEPACLHLVWPSHRPCSSSCHSNIISLPIANGFGLAGKC